MTTPAKPASKIRKSRKPVENTKSRIERRQSKFQKDLIEFTASTADQYGHENMTKYIRSMARSMSKRAYVKHFIYDYDDILSMICNFMFLRMRECKTRPMLIQCVKHDMSEVIRHATGTTVSDGETFLTTMKQHLQCAALKMILKPFIIIKHLKEILKRFAS